MGVRKRIRTVRCARACFAETRKKGSAFLLFCLPSPEPELSVRLSVCV